MIENTPLYPLSENIFYPHYMSDEVFNMSRTEGYTPHQLRSSAGFDDTISAKGIKIAVICAFDNVALVNNIKVFCREFSLEEPKISVHYPQGRADITTRSWITESSLDVQWITAFAQGAEIMCIFSKDASTRSMLEAVKYAKDLSADVISMSFGTSESGAFLSYDESLFDGQSVFVASSGNTPARPSYPSSSPKVLSVGATELVLSEEGKRIGEWVWKNTGSGISDIFCVPDYQKRMTEINELTEGKRGLPDVAFSGSMKYGACVYVSDRGGWTTAGGTSFSCACVSGICACILKHNPDVKKEGICNYLYSLAGGVKYNSPQYNFHDIIIGSNGKYFAEKGWDLCSGLGSITSKAVDGRKN